ncbi:f11a10.2 protein [Cryptosporidium xiaoi]|uniref:F11a10.2 protein n=1 Tax=Cryptosporidium xiaoi TaxID=659607 RepID=A0AAV9XUV6_9CRYT
MDFQHREGHKTGSGALASSQDVAIERRERLRRLALESIDLSKDPYYMRNHLGQVECRLCSTIHTNEGSYLSHTQGRKHQTNLAYRASKDKVPQIIRRTEKVDEERDENKEKILKIGQPKYKITKHRESSTGGTYCIYCRFNFNEILEECIPSYRIMSCWEQKIEKPDPRYQYLFVGAEPYNTVGIRVPSMEINRQRIQTYWDKERKVYHIQIYFTSKKS